MARKTLAAVIAVLLLLVGYWLTVAPTGAVQALPIPRNAVWLSRHWLRGDMTEADMEREVKRMAALGIRTLFVHAGPFNPDGTIPEYDPRRVAMIRRAANQGQPGLRVLAWLGGLNAAGGGDLDLLSEAVRMSASEAALRFTADGFDGVHLNIEPTPTGDDGFLLLLEETRRTLPPGSFLSVATNPWGPWWIPHRLFFSEAYLREIIERVDQIAVMNYDFYAVSGPLYRRISAAQTRAALEAAHGGNGRVSVLIGVPAYPTEGGLRHRAAVESVPNALAGIDAGLARLAPGVREGLEGVAVYAGWTATDEEWNAVGQWHRP